MMSANSKSSVTVAHGNGIGPEVMEATLRILKEAGARLEIETIEIGEAVYRRGFSAGIEPSAWDSLRRTRVFLKAPISTPQGGGFKSLNVTIRKTLGLYANVRPCVAFAPFIRTRHSGMDVVIVRENEEDVYAGIEHRQTDQVYQCLKLITRPGCERIVRYAFEYAAQNGRRKVTCFTKDNIMKMTDGLFHRVFDEIGAEYPDIGRDHMIVDIGAARLADTPGMFDVIVMPNLYGDILSDVAAQIAGSVGLGGSSNIGNGGAMFEAIHGSAPDIAGKDVANPSGLIQSAVMMLVHLGQADVASRLQNAWLRMMEDGLHTADVFDEKVSKRKVGTREFTRELIHRLGQMPRHLKPAALVGRVGGVGGASRVSRRKEVKTLVGVDVFLDWANGGPAELGAMVEKMSTQNLVFQMMTNRGVKVYPEGLPETFCTDHWRCRFKGRGEAALTTGDVIELLGRFSSAGLDFIKTEHLFDFDGEAGYTLGQGQ